MTDKLDRILPYKTKQRTSGIMKWMVFCLCLHFLPLHSVPDLTIVGFIMPETGLGKIPITILETLDSRVSSNFIMSFDCPIYEKLSTRVKRTLQNPDHSAGKVALLTATLWDIDRCHSALVPQESIVKLAYSMFETSRIPDMWVKILNKNFDAVVVPDPFLVRVYEKSGVRIPIFVLPIPMMLAPYLAHPVHSKSASKPFVFGDTSANKNPGILVEAFAKAFGNSSDVRLIMKAGGIFPETRETIDRIIDQFGLTNVIIEEGHFSLAEYIQRLSSFDCYVNLSRGEGFSFIPREALALGVPVIISNNTASKTICKSGCVRGVPCRKTGPCHFFYRLLFGDEDCGEQFDCEVDDVVAALRDVYDNYNKYIKKARQGRKWVNQYDCRNTTLRGLYYTLVKPNLVLLGGKNEIKNGRLVTNSPKLLQKYQQIVDSNL